jgi:hypothetical protein
MSWPPADGLAVADAWPAAMTWGGSGLRTTPRAVAPPVLATTSVAVKDWPRLTVAGTESWVICSAAARWTWIDTVCVALTGRESLASAPDAVSEQLTVPGAVATNVHARARVWWPPSAAGSGGAVCERRLAGLHTAVAETVPAPASPGSETSSDTWNDCPVLTRAGAVPFAESWAGVCTAIVGCTGGEVETAAPLVASTPRACKASVALPAETATICQRKVRVA